MDETRSQSFSSSLEFQSVQSRHHVYGPQHGVYALYNFGSYFSHCIHCGGTVLLERFCFLCRCLLRMRRGSDGPPFLDFDSEDGRPIGRRVKPKSWSELRLQIPSSTQSSKVGRSQPQSKNLQGSNFNWHISRVKTKSVDAPVSTQSRLARSHRYPSSIYETFPGASLGTHSQAN